MARRADPKEFEQDWPDPQDRLMRHNQVVRDNYDLIGYIKDLLARDDYLGAYQHWIILSEGERDDLWMATTKGGILTITERNKLKSDDFYRAMKQYHNREASNE